MRQFVTQLMKRKMSTSTFNPLSPSISLTPLERNITGLLREYAAHYNSTHSESGEKLEPRITGGWVRDKLLGQESHDLDVAVNVMSGQEFAEGLLKFLKEQPGYDESVARGNIHTIERNPEKSKHLETATTKLYGLDIDFVNLRSEEYTEDSRIPQVQFGTPEEDALRRDATLNALFYNIQQEKVEDFTQRGLMDLKEGVLRTPLEPRKTFLDDPLRVLRLVRFASRFGFQLDQETFDAMKIDEVKSALCTKVSRERVGVEMGKTLESDAVKGLELLCESKLIGVVFSFGTMESDVRQFNDSKLLESREEKLDEKTQAAIDVIKSFNAGEKLAPVVSGVLRTPNVKRLFWITTVLRPWAGLRLKINKKKEMWASEIIVREGLKFSKDDADITTKILCTKEHFQELVHKLPEYKRSEIGFLLRNFGEHYKLAFVFNLLDDVVSNGPQVLGQYEKMWDVIHAEKLEDAYKMKPMMNGKEVSKKLDRAPGPWMASVMDQILSWQLDNPEKTEEDCLEYIKSILN